MIAGELRRFLRDFNHIKVSRSMRDLAYKAMQAKERLTAENQKEPTIEEVAKAVGAEKMRRSNGAGEYKRSYIALRACLFRIREIRYTFWIR